MVLGSWPTKPVAADHPVDISEGALANADAPDDDYKLWVRANKLDQAVLDIAEKLDELDDAAANHESRLGTVETSGGADQIWLPDDSDPIVCAIDNSAPLSWATVDGLTFTGLQGGDGEGNVVYLFKGSFKFVISSGSAKAYQGLRLAMQAINQVGSGDIEIASTWEHQYSGGGSGTSATFSLWPTVWYSSITEAAVGTIQVGSSYLAAPEYVYHRPATSITDSASRRVAKVEGSVLVPDTVETFDLGLRMVGNHDTNSMSVVVRAGSELRRGRRQVAA